MRTPNCNCIICDKALYRRPYELKSVRFVCCRGCRGEAYIRFPSKNSLSNLDLGREKGTNHLSGIPKKQSQKDKMKVIMAQWCAEHPSKVEMRGKKIRGDKHYLWNGGVTILNQAIRRMTENRKWQITVKKRDKTCSCGSTNELESHHRKSLVTIIYEHKISSIEEARECKELWDIENGITLCRKCHYKLENRRYVDYQRKVI